MAEKLYVKKSKSSGGSRSNGRKLYGGASSSDGGGSSEQKPDDKGKGLFDIGPIGAVRDALSSSGNLVLEALDKLDMPRAAIVAGAQELGDGFDKLIGNEEVRGGGRLVDTGFNWDDFRQNFNNRVGVGDIIEAAHPDAPHALKVAGGFAGDILTDPLTYLTMGATTATSKGISGSRLVFGDEAATSIIDLAKTPGAAKLGGKETLESVADDVLRNGTGVLGEHPELARAIGLDGAGFNFRGHTIPGTGRAAARTSRAWGSTKRAVTSRTWGKLSPETRRLWERVPGYQRVVDATGSKAKGLAYINSSRNATRVSRDWGTEKAESFTQLHARHADADWTEVRRIIEDGELGKAGRSTPERQAAAEIADWLESIRTEFNELSGKDMPALEDYFPRQLTEDAIQRLQKKRKREVGQASGLEARVLRKGEKFLGEELEVGSIDEIREISQRVLGESKIELFLDDPRAIFNGYIKGLSREMRRHRFLKNLEDTGILEHIDKYALQIQEANNLKAYGELKRQTRRGDKAQRKAVQAGRRGAQLREDNQISDRIAANKEARAAIDSDLDGEAQLIDRLNREMEELAPEEQVDDTAIDAATATADEARLAREAAEQEALAADNAVGVARRNLEEVDAGDPDQIQSQLDEALAAQEQHLVDTATPDDLAAAQADLAAKQKEFERASQKASDIRQTQKGVPDKTTQMYKLEDDAVMDAADDVDDFGDLRTAGPAVVAMEQKASNKKRIMAILKASANDPKWGTPQVNQQIRSWHSQLDQLADWKKAKALGAGVPDAELARLEAEAEKIGQILSGMERHFGLEAPKPARTAPQKVDKPAEFIDQQVVLAEAKQARVAAVRDAAQAQVEALERAITKQGKALSLIHI